MPRTWSVSAAQYKAAGHNPVPSYSDLVVKLTAIARKAPLLCGQWTEQGIRLPDAIHIGIAVDTENGLTCRSCATFFRSAFRS